ncbi:RluA family pseudouridine synthase [Desulfuromonas thiophila]|jgi:RluA family pseudouridine synthase|uniref:23S rRNA pseudouridine955/2504/2580 synthase n=1 Tax=Desulfuromonas thiophila TaxID=57664 RepID=A0A1G6YES7_9BACT|nr:RNA pseudouridine synthase [Desulfuromonas thiophila]MCK9172450.1 RNA pseudouridine synthase [Desulfuromonas thiophila]MDD3802011.1 RNA pseudouridine synthase [Desulfuromonas thiophila]MDY0397458.1 RNA pseudouridine synthase [Desulfuromonas thiophila]SDD88984.1 23S rRNA pseudouridine955/2504/2580 synthase [Desulfuromonas thiophila]
METCTEIIVVSTRQQGQSALEILAAAVPAAGRGYLRQLFKKGRVRCDGQVLAADALLQAGQQLQLAGSARLAELLAAPRQAAEAAGVPVLYESAELLVVDKPAGLAVHGGAEQTDHLVGRVQTLMTQRGERFAVAPIHRLDRATSGPVLLGKGRKACGELGRLFLRQQVEKCYLALVQGRTAPTGELASLLPAKGKLKEARCGFQALRRSEQASLLQIDLQTGRQHQIRRQLAAAGHPLFGDARYGGPCPPALPRLFLHCSRLAFVDPFSGAPLIFDSPLPAELRVFAETLLGAPLP